LHFDRIEDILAEVERLNQGKVQALGNWSCGQVLKHLAAVMNGSIDGGLGRFPWHFRMMGRLFKKRLLRMQMPPGFQLKGQAAAALVPPATTWEEGLHVFREAVRRQQTEPNRGPNPFLGSMTREQWEQLHCRHAELHLSFLVPEAAPPVTDPTTKA
jgi:hypothetical protein